MGFWLVGLFVVTISLLGMALCTKNENKIRAHDEIHTVEKAIILWVPGGFLWTMGAIVFKNDIPIEVVLAPYALVSLFSVSVILYYGKVGRFMGFLGRIW